MDQRRGNGQEDRNQFPDKRGGERRKEIRPDLQEVMSQTAMVSSSSLAEQQYQPQHQHQQQYRHQQRSHEQQQHRQQQSQSNLQPNPKPLRFSLEKGHGVKRPSCENCKQKHIRCNREIPQCQRCANMGLFCVYKEKKRKREGACLSLSFLTPSSPKSSSSSSSSSSSPSSSSLSVSSSSSPSLSSTSLQCSSSSWSSFSSSSSSVPSSASSSLPSEPTSSNSNPLPPPSEFTEQERKKSSSLKVIDESLLLFLDELGWTGGAKQSSNLSNLDRLTAASLSESDPEQEKIHASIIEQHIQSASSSQIPTSVVKIDWDVSPSSVKISGLQLLMANQTFRRILHNRTIASSVHPVILRELFQEAIDYRIQDSALPTRTGRPYLIWDGSSWKEYGYQVEFFYDSRGLLSFLRRQLSRFGIHRHLSDPSNIRSPSAPLLLPSSSNPSTREMRAISTPLAISNRSKEKEEEDVSPSPPRLAPLSSLIGSERKERETVPSMFLLDGPSQQLPIHQQLIQQQPTQHNLLQQFPQHQFEYQHYSLQTPQRSFISDSKQEVLPQQEVFFQQFERLSTAPTAQQQHQTLQPHPNILLLSQQQSESEYQQQVRFRSGQQAQQLAQQQQAQQSGDIAEIIEIDNFSPPGKRRKVKGD